jgi:hypothetical protein
MGKAAAVRVAAVAGAGRSFVPASVPAGQLGVASRDVSFSVISGQPDPAPVSGVATAAVKRKALLAFDSALEKIINEAENWEFGRT